MSLSMLNPGAQQARAKQALSMNISAAISLQSVVSSNLGPRGTLKMLVGGGGDIKLTKDGNVLLHEMQISHPTASLIARTATTQDEITGDGTTSTVLLIGDMLSQAYRYISEGMHPSPIAEGFELAKHEAYNFLQQFKKDMTKKIKMDKETLVNVAKTALRTKLGQEIADKLSTIVVDAIEIITIKDQPLDLHMVEIQSMEHRLESDTKLVRGLVLDHGPRHPDMKTKLKNCYILTCNVSLEYEKSEVNSQFMVSDPNKRQEIIEAERKTVDDKVKQIIALKEKVCPKPSAKSTLENVILPEERNFVVVNQKGIDPLSLDMLAKAGITALRRAKRRNMERLTLCCGGVALNSFDEMNEKCLGYAMDVHEEILGEEKYTFIEGVTNPHSCTILIKAPNKFSMQQIKDSIRDGLRAVKNALEDNCLLPGAGSFEIALCDHLMKFADTVKGKPQIGVKCFAESLLIIPKTLATNSGLDPLDSILKLQQEYKKGNLVGLDLISGDCLDPIQSGIFDNFKVKEQIIESATFTASQLLYVDEILSAGKSQQKIQPGEGMQ